MDRLIIRGGKRLEGSVQIRGAKNAVLPQIAAGLLSSAPLEITNVPELSIDEIAKLLQSDAALKLSIDGHTDSTGTAERNRALSKQRAEAVLGALVAKGIAAERLSAQGFGPDKPVADNGDDAGRAKNRRVELVKQA